MQESFSFDQWPIFFGAHHQTAPTGSGERSVMPTDTMFHVSISSPTGAYPAVLDISGRLK